MIFLVYIQRQSVIAKYVKLPGNSKTCNMHTRTVAFTTFLFAYYEFIYAKHKKKDGQTFFTVH